PERRDERSRGRSREEWNGVAWWLAGGQERQMLRRDVQEAVVELGLAGEHLLQSDLRRWLEPPGDARPSDVRVGEADVTVAVRSERQREIDGDQGFPLRRERARDDDHLGLVLRIVEEEGLQAPESLGSGRSWGAQHDHLGGDDELARDELSERDAGSD